MPHCMALQAVKGLARCWRAHQQWPGGEMAVLCAGLKLATLPMPLRAELSIKFKV